MTEADTAAGDARQQPVWSVIAQLAQVIDRIDAEVLLADVLAVPRLEMLNAPDRLIDPSTVTRSLARRLRGEPVAYITGHREFWSLDLTVTPDVLIPRPDSETLIAAAVAFFVDRAAPRTILDLGTGSGALLLAALTEWPEARGVGIDRSERALTVARYNAAKLGLDSRSVFGRGDWAGTGGVHDLILCNPPYVETTAVLADEVARYEPHEALFAGPEGLDNYRTIVARLASQMTGLGCACLEIGATQVAPIREMLHHAGLGYRIVDDLAGLPRCFVITK